VAFKRIIFVRRSFPEQETITSSPILEILFTMAFQPFQILERLIHKMIADLNKRDVGKREMDR